MNSSFMNVTHLGLPMVYGILGAGALAPATFYAMIVGILNITLGTALASSVKKKRISVRDLSMRVITFPAVFALFVALLFVGFGALPHAEIMTALEYITKPAFVLMLLLVGYEMPFVNPKKHGLNLGIVGTLRLIICPLVTFACMGALGLGLLDKTPKPSLIMAIMPPAVFNIILAHNYKLNMEEYGAMVFYLTFVSVFLALPLMMLLLGF
jgi:predicted permease